MGDVGICIGREALAEDEEEEEGWGDSSSNAAMLPGGLAAGKDSLLDRVRLDRPALSWRARSTSSVGFREERCCIFVRRGGRERSGERGRGEGGEGERAGGGSVIPVLYQVKLVRLRARV